MAALSLRDARTWHLLGFRVAGAVEARLDVGVLANRTGGAGRGWRIRPLGPALAAAGAAARRLAAQCPVVLRTDVAGFYPTVTPPVLADTLRRAGVGRPHARTAADLLEGWGSSGYPGLPIGPEASAVMANAVLREADLTLGCFPFLRWVDDYLVALPSERAAAEALDRLDGALDGLGLLRSEPKTTVLEGVDEWLGRSTVAVRGRSCGSAAPGCRTPRGP